MDDRTAEIKELLAFDEQHPWAIEGAGDFVDHLRYLLDLNAELQGRVSALEEALRSHAVFLGAVSGRWVCGECEGYGDSRETVHHRPDCIVLTLPAEPVAAPQS